MKKFKSSSMIMETNTKYKADLHNFKMNLSRTLNSYYFATFNKNSTICEHYYNKRCKRLSSTPTIPLKVIKNGNYCNITQEIEANKTAIIEDMKKDINCSVYSSFFTKLNSSYVKSKCSSPFLLRKMSMNKTIEESLDCKNDNDEKISIISSVSYPDSGLSSVNSTQLFLADLRECLRKHDEEDVLNEESQLEIIDSFYMGKNLSRAQMPKLKNNMHQMK